jgi:hypothetical protein
MDFSGFNKDEILVAPSFIYQDTKFTVQTISSFLHDCYSGSLLAMYASDPRSNKCQFEEPRARTS